MKPPKASDVLKAAWDALALRHGELLCRVLDAQQECRVDRDLLVQCEETFACMKIVRSHLAAAERAEKASDHAE